MGVASSSKDPFGRSAQPAAAPYVLGRDRFKEQAEAAAAKKAPRPKDAFAGTARTQADAYWKPADPNNPPVREAGFRADAPPPKGGKGRTLSNGAALHVVASAPREVPADPAKIGEMIRERRAGKSSSLVLVSSTALATASVAEATGGPGELAMPKVEKPAPKAKVKSGGGGSGGSGGGGAYTAPRDRVFNQDDLMGVLIVLAMLLLLALYLLRGGAGSVQDPERLVDVQSAATEPAAPVGPPPDPFGDKAVDLTPKTPIPVTPEVAAEPPPPPVIIDVRFNAYFCTAKSELTAASMAALDKQIAVWESLEGKEMLVTGYADTRGASEYNAWLGGERAKAVANYLQTKGIAAKPSAVGELPGLADNENCANQRRVDVRLADAPVEPPSKSCAPPPDAAEMVCG
ncbi:MAG: OmpA family protein [Hyphomonadaceae bacterium]|nr:OmpA family protein [Hyphomonadaceae bacterium]